MPHVATSADPSPTVAQAERGWQRLRTEPYAKADLQAELFAELWQVWPEPLKQRAQAASDAERRRMSFSRYGLITDPARPDGPPIGVVEDGHGGWVMSCLSCHQGKVAGQVIPGVGNSHFAFQTLVDDVNRAQLLFKKPRNPMNQMFPLGGSNGTTNAQTFSVFLTAMRDKELNQLPLPIIPKFQHHDLDAPPLWNVKIKRNLYIDGFVPKTHRVIMQFSLVPTNDRQAFIQREDAFRDILDWIESLPAPKYPWPVDQPLANSGEVIYRQSCAQCHGTHGADADYPEVMVPIDEVGTDSVRLTGMPAEHRRFYSESWFGEFGKLEVVEQPVGYIAPPLNGIWASAPYFHNGAVPTLWHVLHSAERPRVWSRTEDGYDQQRVGLEIVTFDRLPAENLSAEERRRYFDTALPSKSASGHFFPDPLSEDDKRALLEYLKTL
ncbi:MAG: cytochrome c [Pirellulaceae bacterium]|nr:cytochrome c [Pirellulaceae bacterium]